PPKSKYIINAGIDITNKVIEGEETVTFINSSNRDIKIIAVDWLISGNSTIKISMDGIPLSLLNNDEVEVISSPLIYSLRKPLEPGEKIQLEIKFSSKEIINNIDKIQSTKWYPRLWWDGIYTFDSYKIQIDIPDGYELAIGGKLNESTGYYENVGVRTCGICLVKGVLKEQKFVDDIVITALFTEEGSECARLCLNTAYDAVNFYKEWLGFYPFKFLYIIPGASEPWGGYPFSSGIVVIHGQEKFDKKLLLHWKWITAHEIGHQYWGEYVFDDSYSWLWIGLGVYTDREYSIYKNFSTDKHTGMMSRYTRGIKNYLNTTADLTPAQIGELDFDYNNVIKHGKGFSIVSALECVLGKELFIKIFKRCLSEYSGKYLRYRDFWRICEEESGENLEWFFEQWIRSNKYLSHKIVSQDCSPQNGEFISKIDIKSYGTLEMPVPIKAVFEDGSAQTKYTERLLEENQIIFKSKSKLTEAVIDPDNKLAMVEDTSFISMEEVTEGVSQLSWEGDHDEALNIFSKASQINLKDYYSWYKLGLILFASRDDEEALQSFQKALELGSENFIIFVWIGHMNDLKGDRETALEYYNMALEHDTGGSVQHSQFGLKINREWVEERLKTPFTFEKN
ncbi:M1 family aminopeptidase, partial [Bacteroidota bacterium]